MFANTTAPATPMVLSGASTQVSEPLTLEDILQLDSTNIGLLEGGVAWPRGSFLFTLEDVAASKYDIKKPETHPNLGKPATMMQLKFTCHNVGAGLINHRGEKITVDEAQLLIGKVYTEMITFGNDGVELMNAQTKRLETNYPGAKQLKTLIHNIHGKTAYEALISTVGGNMAAQLKATMGKKFGCIINHSPPSVDKKDGRVYANIAIFDKFVTGL